MLSPTRRAKPLAAILTALDMLGPSDERTVEAMLRMMGYDEQLADPAVRLMRKQVSVGRGGSGDTLPDESRLRPDVRREKTDEPRQRDVIASELVREDGGSSPTPPEWLENTVLLPSAGVFKPAYRGRMPSLFVPRKERSLIFSLVARRVTNGEIDIAAATETMARLGFSDRMPLRHRRSVRRGGVLLVDLGSSMQPFAFDTQALSDLFRSVVGQGLAEIRYFQGHPRDGAIDPETGLPAPWRGFRRGAPVVVVTDFGIGRPADAPRLPPRTRAWTTFALEMAAAGMRLMAIVPYPKARLPAGIVAHVDVIEWTRVTTPHGRAVP